MRWYLLIILILLVRINISAVAQEEPVKAYPIPEYITRPWIGPDFWANRLQDWRINIGRIECVEGKKPMRTLHLISSEIGDDHQPFEISVRTGILGFNYSDEGTSWTGFLIGAGNNGIGYQAASLVHHLGGSGGGIIACFEEGGQLSFRSNEQDEKPGDFPTLQYEEEIDKPVKRNHWSVNWEDYMLTLKGIPLQDGQYKLELSLTDYYTGKQMARTILPNIDGEQIKGNIALVSHGGKTGTRYWFRDLQISGKKFVSHPERRFGPILNCFYSINHDNLKLSAQFPPLGFGDAQSVKLTLFNDDEIAYKTETKINPKGWLALFDISSFDRSKGYTYEVEYELNGEHFSYSGKIKKDPENERYTKVAAFTCYQVIGRPADDSWGVGFAGMPEGRWTKENLWFPHKHLTEHVSEKDPDLLVFLGDQIYEGGNPTDADMEEGNPTLDFLYKYFIFLWDMKDITKDRPAILLTDDHDVYQGDLWGGSGEPSRYGSNKAGGYVNEPEFVNTAEYVMTAHNPGLYDPSPVKQNIGVYYGSFNYGGISFAILEDRKFKSLPTIIGNYEKNGSKIVDPEYNVEDGTSAGATLLGDRQLNFLRHWIEDWDGSKMKVAISQTAYASMHTTPEGDVWKDLDSNGWPPSGRNKALDIIRRAHALMLGGDTHLAAVVQHGIEEYGDASYQFVVPAISNKYRRWWSPGKPELTDDPTFYGDHLDGFNNKITVKAIGNPLISNKEVYETNKKLGNGYGSEHIFLDQSRTKNGYGLIIFDKKDFKITMECWSEKFDESGNVYQYKGWPVVIKPEDNFTLKNGDYLPEIRVSGDIEPIVKIRDDESGELVSTIRLHDSFTPRVRKAGDYLIEIINTNNDEVLYKDVVGSSKKASDEIIEVK